MPGNGHVRFGPGAVGEGPTRAPRRRPTGTGNDPQLRARLRARGLGHVLGVARDHGIGTLAGTRRAIDLAVTLPASVWQTRSAGPGSKGHRWYEWALVHIDDPDPRGEHRLLIRRKPAHR